MEDVIDQDSAGSPGPVPSTNPTPPHDQIVQLALMPEVVDVAPARSEESRRESAVRWQRALYVPLTVLAWLVVAIVVAWLIGHVSHTLVIVVLGAILAFALAPLVNLLTRWLKRPFAVLGAYLIGVALVGALGAVLVVTAAGQVVALVANLPAYYEQIRALEPQFVSLLGPIGITGPTLQSMNQQILTQLQAVGATLAGGSIGVLSGLAGVLIDTALVLMLSIYFTLGGSRVATWVQQETPADLRRHARFMVHVVNQVVGGYVRGALTMAVLIGALVAVGLTILGVRYALLLGVLAFFMAFVPVVGVLISGAVSLALALPHGLITTLLVLVYFVAVHVIEGDLVGPRVMGRAVGIHPATGIIALVAGTELFGVWGALFAAPVAGLLQAIAGAVWRELRYGEAAAVPVIITPATAEADGTPGEPAHATVAGQE